MDLVIKSARVVTEQGVMRGGIAVEGDQIALIAPDAELPVARRVIDAQENFAIPGFIDPHVHLRGGRLGSTVEVLRSAFQSETRGAVHGGVTTAGLFTWSYGDEPLASGVRDHARVGNELSHVDFFTHAVLTREEHVEEIPALAREYGCWSFKHFFNANKPRKGGTTVSAHPGVENDLLFRSLEAVRDLGPPALGMVHCEDQDIIWVLEDRLKAAGRADLRAWAEARPGWVEHLRMRIAYEIARAVGAPLYCVHVAAAEGVDLLAEVRRSGYPYWAETCPHYLTHTADLEEQIGCWGRVNTAIKFERDRDRLWAGIKDGSISNMGTDHSSFSREIKESGGGKHDNIWNARSGITGGMEHWLPVMMTYGVAAGRISIEDMVRVCATNNAKVFGLYPRKGTLRPGSDADIVLVDPEREVTISPEFYRSGADWSIYYGWRVKGLARYTILRGQVLLDEFEAVRRPGTGRYVVPG